jgi:hypothetical protein
MDTLLSGLFVLLVLVGFAGGVLMLLSGVRMSASYRVWRQLLADQGILRLDWQSGMWWRVGDELDAFYRLYVRVPEDDPNTEGARLEARRNALRFLGWWVALGVTAGVAILVALAAGIS